MQTIDQIYKAIGDIEDECQNKTMYYLDPIIKAEFAKVRKQNPRLYGVTWGMGTYMFCFEPEGFEEDEDWWWNANHTIVPEYARRLIELVALASDKTGGLRENIDVGATNAQ